jgi:hypothetical protein
MGVVVHAWAPSTQEAEADVEFEASMGYIDPVSKKQSKTHNKKN